MHSLAHVCADKVCMFSLPLNARAAATLCSSWVASMAASCSAVCYGVGGVVVCRLRGPRDRRSTTDDDGGAYDGGRRPAW